jgi:hypothetical protein
VHRTRNIDRPRPARSHSPRRVVVRLLQASALCAAAVLGSSSLMAASAGASGTAGAPAPALAGSCHGPADFGAVYLGAVWPGGFRGVPVYSNGVSGSFTSCLHSTRTPLGRVVVDGYEWQCVELVDRLYLSKGWIESAWLGNGDEMYRDAPRGLSRQPQGHITFVHPGDVISFNAPGGGAGHAAVIGRVQGNYLTIVNQNTDRASVLSHAYLRGGRLEMVGWAGWSPIGVVHAPERTTPKLVAARTSLRPAAVNNGYVERLAVTGGTSGKRWSVTAGATPLGVSVSPSGRVDGVAMTTGNYAFAATVRDSIGQRASEVLRMHVAPIANLLRDPNFAAARLRGWHVAAARTGAAAHARSVSQVSGVPSGSSDVVLSTSAPGGSLFQQVRAVGVPGDSYMFSGWFRADPAGGRASTRVCLQLWGLSAGGAEVGHGATCRSFGKAWTHASVPFDVNSGGFGHLRAAVVVEAAGTIDAAGTELHANGLQHAGFARDDAAGWQLLPPRAGGRVNGRAYGSAAGQLPIGTNYFQMNSRNAGGSVYQDVQGILPVGQGFRLAAWVRANDDRRVRVCLAMWGLGRVRSASRCASVGSSWTYMSITYKVRSAGERNLRAQFYVDSARRNVDLNGVSLVNTAG